MSEFCAERKRGEHIRKLLGQLIISTIHARSTHQVSNSDDFGIDLLDGSEGAHQLVLLAAAAFREVGLVLAAVKARTIVEFVLHRGRRHDDLEALILFHRDHAVLGERCDLVVAPHPAAVGRVPNDWKRGPAEGWVN